MNVQFLTYFIFSLRFFLSLYAIIIMAKCSASSPLSPPCTHYLDSHVSAIGEQVGTGLGKLNLERR